MRGEWEANMPVTVLPELLNKIYVSKRRRNTREGELRQ